jgi:hypothetical protein
MEPLKISLNDICRMTGESLPLVHDAIRKGHLRTFVVGRRRFARPADVRLWVDYLQSESDAGRPVKYRGRKDEREVA